MARRYNGRYQSRAGAIVAAIVSTLIICALAVGAWVHWDAVSGFFKDIALMFEIAQEKVEQEKAEREEQASGFIFDDNGFEEGIFLASARIEPNEYAAYEVVETAESAYTITATIEPANATQTALEWTVEFVDASSTWANGKTVTDYVTVSPYGDNSAVVSCLQPFGEQINVKVTLAENTALRASCTCDYAEKILDMGTPYFNPENDAYGNVEAVNGVFFDEYLNWMARADIQAIQSDDVQKTIGTIALDNITFSASIQISDSFYSACSEKSSLSNYLKSKDFIEVEKLAFSIHFFTALTTNQQENDLIKLMCEFENRQIANLKFTATCGEETFEKVFPVYAGTDWVVKATNVTLSDSNLTF